MTICLGVLCDGGKKAVVAADRMLTGGDVQFEQEVHKIHQVTNTCVILSAGSALSQVELIRNVRNGLEGKRNPGVMDVVTELKREFVEARKLRAEELHLKPIGMDFDYFISHQDRLPESLLLGLTRQIQEEQLNLEFLVAGVDGSGAHLYHIMDPGIADCFDAIGFCSIGIGERHAELIFIRSGYSPNVSLMQAMFLAYQAKRDAEVAPGVGSRFTDIGVIDGVDFHFIHPEVIESLREEYKALMGFHSVGHGEIQRRIDALQLKWAE